MSTTSSAFIRRSRCWRLSDAKFVEEALETDLQAQERLWRSYRYVKLFRAAPNNRADYNKMMDWRWSMCTNVRYMIPGEKLNGAKK